VKSKAFWDMQTPNPRFFPTADGSLLWSWISPDSWPSCTLWLQGLWVQVAGGLMTFGSCAPRVWWKRSPLPPLPASPTWLSNLPGVPEALWKNLCSADCRHFAALCRRPVHPKRKDHGSRSSIYCRHSISSTPLAWKPPKNDTHYENKISFGTR